jgi:hypothetical protein
MPSFENNITQNVGNLVVHYYCENHNFPPNKMLKLTPDPLFRRAITWPLSVIEMPKYGINK